MKSRYPSCRAFFVCLLLGISVFFAPALKAADYTVTNIADSGAGSLRAALNSSNTDNADSSITFDPNFFSTLKTITLATGLGVANNGSLTITGPATGVEISGNQARRVFAVATGANVTFTRLNFIRGRSDLGGGINNDGNLTVNRCKIELNQSTDYGGGIYNTGVLAVNECTFSGNRATTSGGAINNGAYISNGRSSMTMTGSTLYSNTAADGGALFNRYESSATVSNCTFRQNVGQSKGGGVYNDGGAVLTNCTFVSNFANSGMPGGGMFGSVFGGLDVVNCLGVVNQPDTFGPRFNDGGGNVQAASMFEAGLENTPQNNGGVTETYALFRKGSAVNAGVNSAATLQVDQRGAGYPRLVGGRVDSGAFESSFMVYVAFNYGLTLPVGGTATIDDGRLSVIDSAGDPVTYQITGGPNHGTLKLDGIATTSFSQADLTAKKVSYTQNGSFHSTDSFSFSATDGKGAVVEGTFLITITEPPSLVVTTIADIVATDGLCSLREAITFANSNSDQSAISFDIPVNQQVAGTWTISLNDDLNIEQTATITGPGADKLTVRAAGENKTYAVFVIHAEASLSGLALSKGSAGVVNQNSESVSLTNCKISENSTGIYSQGSIVMTGCIVSGSTGPGLVITSSESIATLTKSVLNSNGYGVVNSSTASATDCTFSNNTQNGFQNTGTANITNCTMSGNAQYGFLNVGAGPATLINCTISGNSTGVLNTSTSTMTNCTVTGNSSTGILNPGTFTVNNSVIAGNTTNLSENPISGANNISTGTAADAGLSPSGLQNNGGPTQTIALLASSPAINAGNDTLAPAKDQRGIARPQGMRSDIGAYEFVPGTVADTIAPNVTVVKPGNSQVLR